MNHTSLSLVENEAQGRNLNGEETGGQGDGERGAEHNADNQAGHHGDDQAGDVVPGVFQLRLVGKQGVEQEQADDGPEGEAQLVQQEEVDHHQGDRTPEFELVVVFHEEAAGLDKKALARLDPGPPLQGDQQDAQNHQNSNGDDGENPVLG